MRFASLSSIGALSLLILAADRWRRTASACAAGFFVGIGPYLCWSRLHYGGFFETFRRGWQYLPGCPGIAALLCKKFRQHLLLGHTRRDGAVGRPLGLALEANTQWDRPDRGQAGRTVTWSRIIPGLWAAVVLVFFFALPHQEPRYAMPLAPPLFLIAGSGLSVLLTGRQTACRVVGSVLVAGALAYSFLPDDQRFESPFVERGVSEEMEVSEFLTTTFRAAPSCIPISITRCSGITRTCRCTSCLKPAPTCMTRLMICPVTEY